MQQSRLTNVQERCSIVELEYVFAIHASQFNIAFCIQHWSVAFAYRSTTLKFRLIYLVNFPCREIKDFLL